jgi:hypothetical protein
VRYAITSLSRERASAEQLLEFWRGHWKIESLHWVRDVVFGEDKCRVKSGRAPHNLAMFRNAAINLLRLADIAAKIPVKARSIAPKLRRFARHPRRLFAFLSIVKK